MNTLTRGSARYRSLRLMFKRINLHNQKLLAFLIVLDLFMAASATYVDWNDFFMVPWYLILFVPICPLYPLLLAVNFYNFRKLQKFSQPLLHFTLIGTIGYGIMAYIFYPTYLTTKGFAWYELGNMAWVTIYASQTLLLLPFLKQISLRWYMPMLGYFLAKDVLDRFSQTFSYHRENVFISSIENFFFATIIILHIISFILILKRSQREMIQIPQGSQNSFQNSNLAKASL